MRSQAQQPLLHVGAPRCSMPCAACQTARSKQPRSPAARPSSAQGDGQAVQQGRGGAAVSAGFPHQRRRVHGGAQGAAALRLAGGAGHGRAGAGGRPALPPPCLLCPLLRCGGCAWTWKQHGRTFLQRCSWLAVHLSAGLQATNWPVCTCPPARPQVVLSHTPFRQLVPELGDAPVLVSGRGPVQVGLPGVGSCKSLPERGCVQPFPKNP